MRLAFDRVPGGISVRFSPAERELLERLPEILTSVGRPATDPAAARLAPVAYPDDEEAEAEFFRLVADQRDQARDVDRDAYLESLARGSGTRLSEEESEAWLRVVTETRLVLGARLGIADDGWEYDGLDDAPEAAFLHYLSWLQESLIEALTSSIPDEAQS